MRVWACLGAGVGVDVRWRAGVWVCLCVGVGVGFLKTLNFDFFTSYFYFLKTIN